MKFQKPILFFKYDNNILFYDDEEIRVLFTIMFIVHILNQIENENLLNVFFKILIGLIGIPLGIFYDLCFLPFKLLQCVKL